VRPVSEGVCPRALAELDVDLPAPPDAAAARDQGLTAVPSDAGELAKFEHSICELNYEVQSCLVRKVRMHNGCTFFDA
jgi:hypothetical protein